MKMLTKDQMKCYADNGYVVLDILTESEIEELSTEYDAIFTRKAQCNLEATWQGDWNKEKTQTSVSSIHSLQMHSAVYSRFLHHKKLLDACEDIMETPNILLHHTKAHLKPPGVGSPFPMHQDYHYFPFEKDSMIAVFVSMDDADPHNGGLCVYPGSHKLGPQEDVSNVDGWHYLSQEKFPLENATPLSLKKGQIVIFSYLLIHGSYNNNSDRVRRMYLVQLSSAEDTMISNLHPSACQGMVLRGACAERDANIKKRHNDHLQALQKSKGGM
ncbi:unnamed protein product [Meganyctiphanes norvegica]|uniref:phytanoyl-CoA dioxygenase n=1 Tax=Meganyctiphanes norvegica TaxID=48144 RepID=A0AAV2RB28_MEGNR